MVHASSSAAGRVSENWQDVLREAGIVLVHAQLVELVIRQVAQKPPLKPWIVNLIPLLERRSSKEILHKNIIITTVELKGIDTHLMLRRVAVSAIGVSALAPLGM